MIDPNAGEADKLKLLQTRLSDTEQGNLFLFCQNKDMVLAVEKAMNYSLYQMGTIASSDTEIHDINWAYAIAENTNTTDEQVGRALRVKKEALTMMGDAFRQILKFGTQKIESSVETNPAL